MSGSIVNIPQPQAPTMPPRWQSDTWRRVLRSNGPMPALEWIVSVQVGDVVPLDSPELGTQITDHC
jgi:hypothetical protein